MPCLLLSPAVLVLNVILVQNTLCVPALQDHSRNCQRVFDVERLFCYKSFPEVAVACKKYLCVALFTVMCRLKKHVYLFPQHILSRMLPVLAASTTADCNVCVVALPHLTAKRKLFLIYMSPVSHHEPWATGNQPAMLYARSPLPRTTNLEAARLMNLPLRLNRKKSN